MALPVRHFNTCPKILISKVVSKPATLKGAYRSIASTPVLCYCLFQQPRKYKKQLRYDGYSVIFVIV